MVTSSEEVRKRDIILLVFCILSILISFGLREGELSLEESWKEGIPESIYSNGHFPLPHEYLPPALITDVEGDGRNGLVLHILKASHTVLEIIVATGAYTIKILNATGSLEVKVLVHI
jgi:hypothetical protein